jgi:hypothetical protein
LCNRALGAEPIAVVDVNMGAARWSGLSVRQVTRTLPFIGGLPPTGAMAKAAIAALAEID